jgi:hypothetical protein
MERDMTKSEEMRFGYRGLMAIGLIIAAGIAGCFNPAIGLFALVAAMGWIADLSHAYGLALDAAEQPPATGSETTADPGRLPEPQITTEPKS